MKAISSMATRHVLADYAAAATAAGLPNLQIESVGGVDAARRVAAGESFDLVFLADDALAVLSRSGHVDTVTRLLLSQVAVALSSDATPAAIAVHDPAFADAAALRAALRAATRIGYSTGPSGTALLAKIDGWEMREELAERLVQARPGVPVARLLADGDIDLGFQQLSELVGEPGLRILGILPSDCAIDTVFSGAIASTCTDRSAAHDVLSYFASDAVAALTKARSFGRAEAR